ncbi:MAG: CHRD domain-containing protein [Pseudonocardiaceae bacterium]
MSSILFVAALPGTAAASPDHRDHEDRGFSIRLTPEEVRGGGDHGGRGFARLVLNEEEERACYVIQWSELEGAVTAAHVHYGRRYNDGPHVIDLFDNKHFNGDDGTVWNCVRVRDHGDKSARETIRDIINHPSQFYLNVHTTAFEDGAIRGQLD